MSIYAKQDGTWTAVSSPPQTHHIRIRASDSSVHPDVQCLNPEAPILSLTGAAPRPGTDTTHTVAYLDPQSDTGTSLFAVHAQDRNLVFENFDVNEIGDIGPNDIDHVQSALNEILIPVYIDDVVSDLSERTSGLLLLHTVQYRDEGPEWSYFRASAFENGELHFEDEYGEL